MESDATAVTQSGSQAAIESPEENTREALEALQKQLDATMEMNQSLRKELSIHKNINTSQHNNYARPELQQQLCEIHMLRERLQESIDNNDRLRCLLEKRLLNLGVDADAVRAALSSEHAELRSQMEDLQECLNHRENAICDLRRQLDCTEQALEQSRSHCADLERSNNCYKRELCYKNDLISELQCRVAQKEEYIQKLLQDNDEKAAQIKCYQNENCRLANDLQKTQNRVMELQQLNKEMHCDLCNLQQQVEMEGSAMSSMLGCELRGLREQLECSINNNFQLTQHLEEKLPQIPSKFNPGHLCDQTRSRPAGCPPLNCNLSCAPASYDTGCCPAPRPLARTISANCAPSNNGMDGQDMGGMESNWGGMENPIFPSSYPVGGNNYSGYNALNKTTSQMGGSNADPTRQFSRSASPNGRETGQVPNRFNSSNFGGEKKYCGQVLKGDTCGPKGFDPCAPNFSACGPTLKNDPCMNPCATSYKDPCAPTCPPMKPSMNTSFDNPCNMKMPCFDNLKAKTVNCCPMPSDCKPNKPNFDWSKFDPSEPCKPRCNPWDDGMKKIQDRVNNMQLPMGGSSYKE